MEADWIATTIAASAAAVCALIAAVVSALDRLSTIKVRREVERAAALQRSQTVACKIGSDSATAQFAEIRRMVGRIEDLLIEQKNSR